MVTGKVEKSKVEGLVAMETRFGWVVGGPVPSTSLIAGSQGTFSQSSLSFTLRINTEPISTLDQQMREFNDLETLGIRNDEKSTYEVFEESIRKNSENRYEVNLPFKENKPILHDNFELSKKRLLKLHSKLKNEPELLKQYDDIFKEQMTKGVIEPAPKDVKFGEHCYLPHTAVVKEERDTTKVRIVFDASAKEFGPSLNECLYKGPQLTPLLFNILLRFRSKVIALTADIEKAFHQISVENDDRDYLRFLWFDDVFSDQPTIVRNRFARVIFGVTSSPFLLNGTIKQHVKQF